MSDIELSNAIRREASVLIREGRYEDALRTLKDHVSRFPDDRDADYLLGHAAYRAGDDDLALEAFGRCVHADPRSAPAQYGLGITLRRLGELDAARTAFEATLEAEPGREDARKHLAELVAPDRAADTVRRAAEGSEGIADRELLRLRVLAGPAKGREITVDRSPWSIGRGRDADEQLGKDPDLSRQHAVLRLRSGAWQLEDVGSRNGTHVNGRPFHGVHALRNGDEIAAGGSILVVELADEDAGTGNVAGTPDDTSLTQTAPVVDVTRERENPPQAEELQDESLGRPRYAVTLSGPVVIGRVEDVQQRTETRNQPLKAYSARIQQQPVSVLALRISDKNDLFTAVELRGLTIDGTFPRKGDRVAVPEQWQNGALRVRRLQNLETGEIVAARDASAFAKGLYWGRFVAIAVIVVAVLVAVAIFVTQVLPDLLEKM